ncbi:hypothetical protein AC578_10551 [Pseudocercospora eumusae]|uniref:Uncharacterized protein n=1 Tax=Pseudocercospora eumusae TaxID=321146 RepID=A0A139H5U8_9PEZI|nr:hypothetical protein AC578_10551 [Pseudocercospora eumusae]
MMDLEDRGDHRPVEYDAEDADDEAEDAELRDMPPDPLHDQYSQNMPGNGWYHQRGIDRIRKCESDFHYHDEPRYDSDEDSEYG